MNETKQTEADQQAHLGFVIFVLQDNHYALPAMAVGEVVERQPVTPIPFMPQHVDGVVNIGGQALPQLDLGRYLVGDGFARPDDYELLLLDSDDAPFAIAVDRVLARLDLPADQVRQVAGSGEIADGAGALMRCEITWDDKTVIGLDPAGFARLFTTTGVGTGRPGLLARETSKAHSHVQQSKKFIIVRDGAEHYGLQVTQVLEIVDMGQITPVPSAPPEAIGIGMLRKDPMLVLSLHTLLHGTVSKYKSGTVLIVERDHVRYGLLVDELEGIIELADSNIRHTADGTGLAGVLIDESGQLDGWLDVDGLIHEARARALRAFSPVQQVIESRQVDAFRQVLQISIGGEKFAVPLGNVRRVMHYTAPEPVRDSTRPWLIGVIDVDGDVVAVTDIAEDLGQAGHTEEGSFVIVGDAACEWALMVRQVDRILDIPEANIESIPESDGGYVNAVAVCDGELISILDLGPMFESVSRAMESRA